MRRWPIATIVLLLALTFVPAAEAGMPGVSLSSMARMRLEVISFFFLGFVFSSTVIWWIWNSLARDFLFLPKITLGKSCGLVALWGLLFVVVLTMISGARELMTPGAWERTEQTYRLRDQERPESTPASAGLVDARLSDRREKLERLGIALARHAALHEGRFPAAVADVEPLELWQIPQAHGEQYGYLPGRSVSDGKRLIAYEPDSFDDHSLVLHADVSVSSVSAVELRRMLQGEAQ